MIERTMPRTASSIVVALILIAGGMVGAARARASWVRDNCNGASSTVDGWTRPMAKHYSEQADGEGYEWGGGCFRLNDTDDTPNLPTDGSGEGTDCSGLVFKAWALQAEGGTGYRYWDHDRAIHGPWSTAGYYWPSSSDPFRSIHKTYASTKFMDALVHRDAGGGHIALIDAEGASGSDWVIHSYTNTAGTLIQFQDFRSQSNYRAVARKGWSPACYPRCQ
jgi:hypothetical protein